jgi:hypothetical protein
MTQPVSGKFQMILLNHKVSETRLKIGGSRVRFGSHSPSLPEIQKIRQEQVQYLRQGIE